MIRQGSFSASVHSLSAINAILFALIWLWTSTAQAQSLRIATADRWDSLDPVINQNSTLSASLFDLIFSTLVSINPKYEFIPHLAQSWQCNDTFTECRFILQSNLKFHDHSLIKTEDIEFSFMRFKTPNSPVSSPLPTSIANIESIIKDSETSVVFRLKKADPDFLTLLAITPIIPKAIYAQQTSQPRAAPVGSGSYRFNRATERELELVAFETSNPSLQHRTLQFLRFKTEEAALAAFIRGEVDVVLMRHADYAQLAIDQMPNATRLPIQKNFLYSLFLNNAQTHLQHQEFRLALNDCIDHEQLRRRLAATSSQRASSPINPASPWGKTKNFPEYNPEKALQRLAALKYTLNNEQMLLDPQGKIVTLHILLAPEDKLSQSLARQLDRYLREIGIQPSFEAVALEALISRLVKKQYDAIIMPFSNELGEPLDRAYWSSGSPLSLTQYKSHSMDQYFEQSRQILDPTNKMTLYENIQKEFLDNPPVLYFFWQDTPLITKAGWDFQKRDHLFLFRNFPFLAPNPSSNSNTPFISW